MGWVLDQKTRLDALYCFRVAGGEAITKASKSQTTVYRPIAGHTRMYPTLHLTRQESTLDLFSACAITSQPSIVEEH